jgi:hypothetical protein
MTALRAESRTEGRRQRAQLRPVGSPPTVSNGGDGNRRPTRATRSRGDMLRNRDMLCRDTDPALPQMQRTARGAVPTLDTADAMASHPYLGQHEVRHVQHSERSQTPCWGVPGVEGAGEMRSVGV